MSIINQTLSRATIGQPQPTVGMGVTILSYSDRAPGTIVEIGLVGRELLIVVQEDGWKCVQGSPHDGSAEYDYFPKIGNPRMFFRLRNGAWERIYKTDRNRWKILQRGGISIGQRNRYYDPSF